MRAYRDALRGKKLVLTSPWKGERANEEETTKRSKMIPYSVVFYAGITGIAPEDGEDDFIAYPGNYFSVISFSPSSVVLLMVTFGMPWIIDVVLFP